MAKYKVGDKVRVKKNLKCDNYYMEDGVTRDAFIGEMKEMCGKVVTIDEIRNGKYRIKEFSCNWVDGMLEGLTESSKIVITTDGKTTTARLFDGKELVKKAEAKCSADDEFDFMVGAKLAMERLEEKKPEKPVNPFKVGDFVEIVSNKTDYHNFPVGYVGRVIEADDDGTCEVDGFYANGGRGTQWIPIEDIKKI